MSGNSYYEYQAKARGLSSPADVERLTDEMSRAYRRILPRWLPADHSAAIYEVACGPGIMLRYLHRAGYTNIAGSDFSACQIELARSAGLNVTQADSIQEMEGHADGAWDCLIAIDFIEHLPKDTLIRFLSLSRRKLKPRGCLIIHTPNGDSPFVGRHLFCDVTHVWGYTTVAIGSLLGMAGFRKIEFVDPSIPLLQKQRWLKVPIMRISQALLRLLIRAAARENIRFFSGSIYAVGWK